MLAALKRAFGWSDGGRAAVHNPVADIPATFEEVAAPADAGVILRRQYELTAEAAEALIAIGMPADIGRLAYHAEPEFDFPIRDADAPRLAARRFLVWMRAVEGKGKHRSEQVLEMYDLFCLYDHRRPVKSNLFLNALEAAPGVTKKRPLLPDGSRDPKWEWTIKPRPFSKALGQASKTPTTDELPDNVIRMPAVARTMAHEARRFARRRHRRHVHPGRRVA